MPMASGCRRGTEECAVPPLGTGIQAIQLSPYRTGVAGRSHTRLRAAPAFHPCSCPLLLLCEFARKKENPSLERFIASPFELCIASILLPAEALSTLRSFSAERPVIRGRGRSHALKLLIRS